jgi:hypothetical protein
MCDFVPARDRLATVESLSSVDMALVVRLIRHSFTLVIRKNLLRQLAQVRHNRIHLVSLLPGSRTRSLGQLYWYPT